MKRMYVVLAAVVAVIGSIVFLAQRTAAPAGIDNERFKVTASFYPLVFLAQEIGGDKVDVQSVTPSGVEPHDYEPTAQDLARIQDSRLLILNGGGLEPWAEKVGDILGDSGTSVLEAGQELARLTAEENGVQVRDPHVWLSPPLAKKLSDRILSEFMRVDPPNADYYRKNAGDLAGRLDHLDQEFRTGLEQCASRDIVTAHAAFGYLAAEYGLRQMPVSGLSPETEPSPEAMIRVAKFVKEHKVSTIFFETLVSPKLAETIARETGARTMMLDPIESGSDYFAHMRLNLANLKLALTCAP